MFNYFESFKKDKKEKVLALDTKTITKVHTPAVYFENMSSFSIIRRLLVSSSGVRIMESAVVNKPHDPSI